MSPESRIYLDFDGVVNALNPDTLHGSYADTMTAGDAVISRTWGQLLEILPSIGVEVIWATHREDFARPLAISRFTTQPLPGMPRGRKPTHDPR